MTALNRLYGALYWSTRMLREHVLGIFHAEDYGTVGDGLADDTAAIQTGLDRAAEARPVWIRRPILRFLPGSYRVIRAVEVRSRVKIRGAGMSPSGGRERVARR